MTTLIAFLLANSIVSWIASIIWTGDKNDEKYKNSLIQPIANKRWKTFLIMFIGYCIIAFIVVYFNYEIFLNTYIK